MRLPASATLHKLAFASLSPADFERLCLWLIDREGYEHAEALGESGNDQGVDILAERDGQRIAFQCKRVQRFSLKSAQIDIEKIRSLPKELQPTTVTFLTSCAVSADLRGKIRAVWGDDSTCHFWSGAELDLRVKHHDDIVREFFLLPPIPNAPQVLWNVPRRNPYFTGRTAILDRLYSDLTNPDSAQSSAALYGLGGIGKTQIAIEFCHRHRQYFDATFWVLAENASTIRSGLIEIADLLSISTEDDEESTLATVNRWLESHEKWLVVFDNADYPNLLARYLPRNPEGRILITSCASDFSSLGIRKTISVNVLPPDDAHSFLWTRTDREPSNAAEQDAARKLAKELGNLPLALEQAAAYISTRRTRFSSYLSTYLHHRLDLLDRTPPQTGEYTDSVATTWSLSFAQVEEASAVSANLLRIIGFLTPEISSKVVDRAGLGARADLG